MSTLSQKLESVEGWLSASEATVLATLACHIDVPGDIVEIGSFKGKSTIALAYGVSKSNTRRFIWAVDPHKGIIKTGKKEYSDTFKEFSANIKHAGYIEIVKPIVETSREAGKQWNHPIALLFLDGLHDVENTREDYRMWARHVVAGGVVAFHDGFCGESGVWEVISNNVFRRHDLVDIGTSGSILYVVLGKPGKIATLRVARKKRLIRLANWIYRKRVPWLLQKFGIHIAIRALLLTKFTRRKI